MPFFCVILILACHRWLLWSDKTNYKYGLGLLPFPACQFFHVQCSLIAIYLVLNGVRLYHVIGINWLNGVEKCVK
jgi:hypothetical protein